MSINTLPVEKNNVYTMRIEAYTHDGNGVGKVDNFTVFVPYSAVGDLLDVLIVKVTSSYAFGRIVRIIEPSPSRVNPNCPVFGRCGGCRLMHISYEEQLKLKRQTVIDALQRIGGFKDIEVMPVIGADLQFRYRNKAQYPIGISNNAEIVSGFYAPHSHNIIPSNSCLIQHQWSDTVVSCVKKWMKTYNISPYDWESGKGLIRHVYTRIGFESGEIMVVIVSTTAKLPRSNELIGSLRGLGINIKSIMLNINKKPTNVVLGKDSILLWGKDKITDSIGGIKFLISLHSFYQVNPRQTKVLYQKAIELAQIKPADTVFDIYCGIGTISLFAAKYCKAVHGIEIVPEAIADAKENAKLNGISNAVFHCGDAAEVTRKLKDNGIIPDVAIIDPPRKGCDTAMIQLLSEMKPARVIYVSCNPSTLARDLRALADKNYNISAVQPVDLFCHTGHVECVVLMESVKNK